MNELLTLTAAELGERIAARQISSEEVTQAHLDRISEVDGMGWEFPLAILEPRAHVATRTTPMRAVTRPNIAAVWGSSDQPATMRECS